jgi:hypothetical protein
MAEAKIQLSYEDLMKLLADKDGEVSIEVKNTIIQNFTQRHLKVLVNHEAMKKVSDVLKAAVATEVAEQVGTQTSHYNSKVKLVPEIKKLIQDSVRVAINDALEEAIAEAKQDIFNRLLSGIESRVNSAVSVEVTNQVRKRVDEQLKKAQKALTETR